MNKTFKVIWTPIAERDLSEIIQYIASDSVSAAKKILTTLKTKADTLTSFPNRGRIVPELQHVGVSSYKELIVKRWRIIYRIDKQTVFVLAVMDSRRDLASILLERLLR